VSGALCQDGGVTDQDERMIADSSSPSHSSSSSSSSSSVSREYFPERLQPSPGLHSAAGSGRSPRRSPRPTDRDLRSRRRRPWPTIVVALVLVGVLLAVVALLAAQTWTGPHTSPLARALLRLDIVAGVVPIVAYVLAVVALLAVAVRTPTPGRVASAAIGTASGALIGIGLAWSLSASNAFGVALDTTTTVWAVVVFAAVGLALSTLWRSGPWRKLVAVLAIVSFVTAGYLGINADFGLDRTVADVAGISTRATLTIPVVTATPSPGPTLLAGGALWANWHAPAGMPTAGTEGQVVIPNTISWFAARPAGLYMPPAALTPNPPALPLVIMMMGQPGNPDPSFSAAVLDRFAAQHNGLAPIVLVADQIGNPSVDPLCLDTARHGKAETYLVQDVVGWARTHLHVLPDAAHWTVAGYSNGGECALALGVKYPLLFGNVLDISGEQYPGADRASATLASDFGGNRAAYDAAKPLNQLAGKTFPDTTAIFTVGSNDGIYRTEAKAVFAATTAAGWKTTYFEVLNGGHVLGALNGGLQEGYTVLYPRLGLTAP
jgi:enterochelin esterase-like enzyme